MSVKSSFFILAMMTFLVAIGIQSLLWVQEREHVKVMAEGYAKELSEGFKQILTLKSEPMKKQSLDYAV